MTRHFLRDDDLTPGRAVRGARPGGADEGRPVRASRPLAGPRSVAVLFDKQSLRTRISFEAGIAELGGHPIVVDTQVTHFGRGETLADAGRVLSRYVAAIVHAHLRRRPARRARRARDAYRWSTRSPTASTPASCSPTCSPSGSAAAARPGRTLAYVGDAANNMAHSYLLAGATAGMHVRVAGPAGFAPDPAVVAPGRPRSPPAPAARSRCCADPVEAVARRRRGGHRHLDVDGAGGRRAGPDHPVPAVPGQRRAARPRPRRTRSCCTACPRTAARRSPTRCSTARRARSSTRRRTGCTPRRRC